MEACRFCYTDDQSDLCFQIEPDFTESKHIIRDHKRIRNEPGKKLHSMLCKEHAKETDKFCISHELPLCDACMEIHAKCTVCELEIVAKGVRYTEQFIDIEKRINDLNIYMNKLLPKLEREISLILKKREGYQDPIEGSEKELTFVLHKDKDEGLRNKESTLITMQSFFNKMFILNMSVQDKKNEIGFSQLYASESEIKLSLPRIEEDLQRYETQLLLNLQDKEIEDIEPIVKCKNLWELTFPISYDQGQNNGKKQALMQKRFAVTKVQRIRDMKFSRSQVFEIPRGKEIYNITGCAVLVDGVMCFVDCIRSQLILKMTDNTYKSFTLPSVPLDITAVSNSQVAILHRTSISVLNVYDKHIDDFKFKPAGQFRFITFHKQNLIICVSGCCFFIVNLQGQKIKEINIDKTLITCISCWNNNIYYANQKKKQHIQSKSRNRGINVDNSCWWDCEFSVVYSVRRKWKVFRRWF